MPGKSKHGKGKRYQQNKKTQYIQRQDNIASAVSTDTPKTAAPIRTVQTQKSPTAGAAAKTRQYAYIPGDLRRIGILTGIIVVILIVLYFILS
jgi:hypothetical protein